MIKKQVEYPPNGDPQAGPESVNFKNIPENPISK
jgi:hypothetical protein